MANCNKSIYDRRLIKQQYVNIGRIVTISYVRRLNFSQVSGYLYCTYLGNICGHVLLHCKGKGHLQLINDLNKEVVMLVD